MKREERLQFLGCVTSVFDTPCEAPYTHARRSHDALCQDCLTSSVAKRFMRRYNIVKIDEKELKVYPVLSQVSWFSYFSSSSREHNKNPYVLLAAFIWLSHWRYVFGFRPMSCDHTLSLLHGNVENEVNSSVFSLSVSYSGIFDNNGLTLWDTVKCLSRFLNPEVIS